LVSSPGIYLGSQLISMD